MQAPPLIDATSALLGAVRTALGGAAFAVEEVRSRSWTSPTFNGARHILALRIDGPGADAAATVLRSRIEADDLSLRGHILADIRLVGAESPPGCARIGIEALTVEDG